MGDFVREYLAVSGIVPITIDSTGVGVRFVGLGERGTTDTLWTEAKFRRRILRRTRQIVGDQIVDRQRAIAALTLAADFYKIRLTPHDIVVERATRLANRLDDCLREMAASGVLKAFHKEYARRRQQSISAGTGFMNFVTAQRRFRLALISRLVNNKVGHRGLIEEALVGSQMKKRSGMTEFPGGLLHGIRHHAMMKDRPTVGELEVIAKSNMADHSDGHGRMGLVRCKSIDGLSSRDMYIDLDDQREMIEANIDATEIYYQHWDATHPGRQSRVRPQIYGSAVLFDRKTLTKIVA